MQILQNRRAKIELLLTAVLVVASAGCGTSNNQAPAATASVAAAPEPAAPSKAQTHPAHAKLLTMRTQTPPEPSTKQNTAMVLSQMHQADLTEVKLGKMAAEKASTDEVRAYANQLVRDHMSVDQMVVAMAHESGTDLQNSAPARRAARHEAAQEKKLERKMESAKGPDFDRFFLRQELSDHDKLIRTLQQDREDTSDDQLEALIDKTMPILEQQKKLAQILIDKEQAQTGPAKLRG